MNTSDVVRAAIQRLRDNVDEVNGMNLFPVPDRDTGSNMLITLEAALSEWDGSEQDEGTFFDAMAYGAMLGARGGSGVILSQMLRGLANGLRGKSLSTANMADVAQLVYDTALSSVLVPVEGTMLTVLRELAETIQKSDDDVRDTLVQTIESIKGRGIVDAGSQGLIYLLEGALNYRK